MSPVGNGGTGPVENGGAGYRQALNKLDLLVLDKLGYVPASKAGTLLSLPNGR